MRQVWNKFWSSVERLLGVVDKLTLAADNIANVAVIQTESWEKEFSQELAKLETK